MKIRWGILGTGKIAASFARGLAEAPDAELLAVGSRTRERAEAFSREYGAARAYCDYESLAADGDLDVIYVATPHALHYENTMMCLEAGRSVLCEKPLATSSSEAAAMIARAASRRLFLMEAMWTFTFPAMRRAFDLVRRGDIGSPVLLRAELGFAAPPDPSARLYSPELAGGALLDVGVYGVALAVRLAGRAPDDLEASAHLGRYGVDETTASILRWKEGPIAAIGCSIRAELTGSAWIAGSAASIEIPRKFSQPDRIVLRRPGREAEELVFERAGNGYTFEALEVMRCLSQGEIESPAVPLRGSLLTLEVCDALRERIGLRFPFESAARGGANRERPEGRKD